MTRFGAAKTLVFASALIALVAYLRPELHLTFNQLEEADRLARKESGQPPAKLTKTRAAVRSSVQGLIKILLGAAGLVIVKPMLVYETEHQTLQALLNGAAILLVLASILVLIDITNVVLAVPASLDDVRAQARALRDEPHRR